MHFTHNVSPLGSIPAPEPSYAALPAEPRGECGRYASRSESLPAECWVIMADFLLIKKIKRLIDIGLCKKIKITITIKYLKVQFCQLEILMSKI